MVNVGLTYVVYGRGDCNITTSELKSQKIEFMEQISPNSCISNAISGWRIGLESGAEYICVMPDDLKLTTNFDEKVKNFVKCKKACWTLFHCHATPGYNPVPDACGMGIVLHRDIVKGLLEYAARTNFKSDSELVAMYCNIRKIPVYVCWPNLTEHMGDISRIYKNATIRKSTWFEP